MFNPTDGKALVRLVLVFCLTVLLIGCDDDESASGPSTTPEPDPPEQPGVLPASDEIEEYPALITQDVEGIFATSEILTSFGLDPEPSISMYNGAALIRGEGQNLSSVRINGYPITGGKLDGWTAGFAPVGFEPERTRFSNDGIRTHQFFNTGLDDAPAFNVEVRSIEPIELINPIVGDSVAKNSDLLVEWSDPDPTGDYYYGLLIYVAAGGPNYNVFLHKDQRSHSVPKINFQTILNNPNGIRVQISKYRYEIRTIDNLKYYFGVAWGTEPIFFWAE